MCWPRLQATAGAPAPDASAQTPATEGRARIEDKEQLKVRLEAPSGWKPHQAPTVVTLFGQTPPGPVISVAYYQPHREAQYQSWTRWTQEKLRGLSATTRIRHRHTLVVAGQKAIQFEWVQKARGTPDKQILETWIARPDAQLPGAGEVFVVMLEGADAPGARAAYARLLESLRFLP